MWSHLLHPDGHQLVSVVGKEGSHVGQERCCQQTVSYQVSHVLLKTLKHTHAHALITYGCACASTKDRFMVLRRRSAAVFVVCACVCSLQQLSAPSGPSLQRVRSPVCQLGPVSPPSRRISSSNSPSWPVSHRAAFSAGLASPPPARHYIHLLHGSCHMYILRQHHYIQSFIGLMARSYLS